MAEWTLKPGDRILRTEIHLQFGGSGRGGISGSAKSPNVFIFSDPESGEQHGYRDSWKDDGLFHYTGEGQRGDQRMSKGNRSLLNARDDGREIRLFQGTGGTIQYKGRFELDSSNPWYQTDAPETRGGPVRAVIVFRLRPLDAQLEAPQGLPPPSLDLSVDSVPVEERNSERFLVDPSREPYEAERKEAELVQRFKLYMEKQGHAVERKRITPPGEAKPIYTDIFIRDLSLLLEAKGGVDRMSLRMAIGQLVDYRRFLGAQVKCAVLVPELPRRDLVDLLMYAEIAIYYPEGKSFKNLPAPEGR